MRWQMNKPIEATPNFERLVLGCINADFAIKAAFFRIFRDIQSPLSGRKKSESTFLPPEKKEHLEDFTAEEVNLGSTLGQPSVNVGSTLGIFPSHLGPILGIFIGCFNQTRKILLTYFSNG